jgi:urate oxidase
VRNGGEALQDGMRRRTTSFLESEQLQAMKGNNTSRIDAVLRRVNIERWQEMEPGRKEIANRGAAYAQAQAQAMAVIAARNDAIFAGTSEIDAGTKRLLPTMRHRAAAWEGFAKQANTLPEINERTKEVTCELEDVATLLRGLAEAVNKI